MTEKLMSEKRCGKALYILQEYEKAKADGKKVLFVDKEQLEKELLGAMDFPEETGHLKKSTQLSEKFSDQRESFIEGRWINEKIEELRKLGYSDEYINKKLGHLVNWRI